MTFEPTTIRLSNKMVRDIDRAIKKKNGFASRAEFIRDAIRRRLEQTNKW